MNARWTDHETLVLLEEWGERLFTDNKSRLSSREWDEVAARISEVSQFQRTGVQCTNRLDGLKKKYKKEKALYAENSGYTSSWIFFNKMEVIYPSSQKRANHKLNVHPSCANSSAEMEPIANPEAQPNCSNSSNDWEKMRADILRDLEIQGEKMLKIVRKEMDKKWGKVIKESEEQ